MQEPLLSDTTQCGDAKRDVRERAEGWANADMLAEPLRKWWSVTTDERYVNSEICFRQRWPWLLPMWGLMFLVMDIFVAVDDQQVSGWIVSDFCFLLVACMISTHHRKLRRTIHIDFVLIVLLLVASFMLPPGPGARGGGGGSPDADSTDNSLQILYGIMFYPLLVVSATYTGFHAAVSPLIVVACMVAVLSSGNMRDGLPVLLLTVCTAAGWVCLEYSAASLFRKLHTQLECNQLLLDGATDGFGVVDSERGVLVSVSPKMAETFGCSDLQARRLDSLIDAADH
eukprot:1199491-Amphidinium_carterae.1